MRRYWNFDMCYVQLWINLESTAVLIILHPLKHEHGNVFLSLNFSQDAIVSSEEVTLLLLGLFLSICFFFIGVVLSRIYFLVLFSGCMLQVHKTVIVFYRPIALFFNHTKLSFLVLMLLSKFLMILLYTKCCHLDRELLFLSL